MEFIKDLYRDEIRDGWLVQSARKKVWQRQLEIWQEVDRICRKHKITYWAGYGTLLGAARHKGFIPWDDDFDLWMMRPDYNRFYDVVEEELLKSGGLFKIGLKGCLIIKITHSQTTLLSLGSINNDSPKGLLIDIFPLDVAPDGTRDSLVVLNAINEVLATFSNYPTVVEHIKNGGKTINNLSVIEKLRNISDIRNQCKFLNVYAESVFNCSSTVNWIEKILFNKKDLSQQKSYYNKTIYLPFETIELPAPIDYDKVLTCCYGDWRKPVVDRGGKLGFIHSADIPYREFLKQIDLKFMFPDIENFQLSSRKIKLGDLQ